MSYVPPHLRGTGQQPPGGGQQQQPPGRGQQRQGGGLGTQRGGRQGPRRPWYQGTKLAFGFAAAAAGYFWGGDLVDSLTPEEYIVKTNMQVENPETGEIGGTLKIGTCLQGHEDRGQIYFDDKYGNEWRIPDTDRVWPIPEWDNPNFGSAYQENHLMASESCKGQVRNGPPVDGVSGALTKTFLERAGNSIAAQGQDFGNWAAGKYSSARKALGL